MQTALLDAHRALGAKIVDFSGWQMPLQYKKGTVHEHRAVRSKVGLFDVSHMGCIVLEGLEAESLLDYLSTNSIMGKSDGTATYTLWCNEFGMVIDDLIIYKQSETRFLLVVNASNREKDLLHLLHYSGGRDLSIFDRYDEDGILALQGPAALPLISQVFPKGSELKHMHFVSCAFHGQEILISHTGYTGESGVEICAPNAIIVDLWNHLLEQGKPFGIEPIGLGARDTLRLEMGYALYGHELSDTILAAESISAWTIKWDKHDFLGKRALETIKRSDKLRHEYGILLKGQGIAREGFSVFQQEKKIGVVTSGTFSPSLDCAIAIVLLDKKLEPGDRVEVEIRGRPCAAVVTTLPFYKNDHHTEKPS